MFLSWVKHHDSHFSLCLIYSINLWYIYIYRFKLFSSQCEDWDRWNFSFSKFFVSYDIEYIYIYIYIYIYMHHHHDEPQARIFLAYSLSLSRSLSLSSFVPIINRNILCPYWADVDKFLLVSQHLKVCVKRSLGESLLWVCPYFSSSVLHVLFVLFGWFWRWEVDGCITAVLWVVGSSLLPLRYI